MAYQRLIDFFAEEIRRTPISGILEHLAITCDEAAERLERRDVQPRSVAAEQAAAYRMAADTLRRAGRTIRRRANRAGF